MDIEVLESGGRDVGVVCEFEIRKVLPVMLRVMSPGPRAQRHFRRRRCDVTGSWEVVVVYFVERALAQLLLPPWMPEAPPVHCVYRPPM